MRCYEVGATGLVVWTRIDWGQGGRTADGGRGVRGACDDALHSPKRPEAVEVLPLQHRPGRECRVLSGYHAVVHLAGADTAGRCFDGCTA